jgi:hypothetical protein
MKWSLNYPGWKKLERGKQIRSFPAHPTFMSYLTTQDLQNYLTQKYLRRLSDLLGRHGHLPHHHSQSSHLIPHLRIWRMSEINEAESDFCRYTRMLYYSSNSFFVFFPCSFSSDEHIGVFRYIVRWGHSSAINAQPASRISPWWVRSLYWSPDPHPSPILIYGSVPIPGKLVYARVEEGLAWEKTSRWQKTRPIEMPAPPARLTPLFMLKLGPIKLASKPLIMRSIY